MLEARSVKQSREKEVFPTELSGLGLGGGGGMEAGKERIRWIYIWCRWVWRGGMTSGTLPY